MENKDRQMYQMHEKGMKEISSAIKEQKAEVKEALSPIKQLASVLMGEIKGKDGHTPVKGVEYFTKEEQDAFVADIMSRIRVPQDGAPGKDAEPVDYSRIEAYVTKQVAKIPKPVNGKDAVVDYDSIVAAVLSKVPKMKNVLIDYPALKKYCLEEIQKIENERESRVRSLNSGGPTTRLGEIVDVNLDGATVNQVLTFDGNNWIASDSAGGAGYTNLTEFVDQTAWRVFYSNGSGDVTELALGADGTFLKSNGATSAPTFATPAGSGDVSKVGTPLDNQIGVWTGDGTLEGDTGLTWSGTALSVDGAAVFNESGLDVDFRIESEDNTRIFEVNAAFNTIGIGTAADANSLLILFGADDAKDLASQNGTALQIVGGNQVFTNASSTVAVGATTSMSSGALTNGTATLTITDASTLYIQNAPTASTNVSIGTAWAMFVDAGDVRIDGSIGNTSNRVTKGWFTDLEVTNAIAGSTTNNANLALSNLASVAINTTLVSDTDNTDALGTAAIAWSDLFLGSGAVITFNSSPSTPDVTITHSANKLTIAGGTLESDSNITTSDGLRGNSLSTSHDGGLIFETGIGQSDGLFLDNSADVDTLTLYRTVVGSIGLNTGNVTGDITLSFPNASGTFALTSATSFANLTSIQGVTVTLADAGADALLGWDDSASAYQNLSAADAIAALGVTATATELNYTDGVTSAIQTQLDARLPLAGGTMTGNITLGENTSIALDPAGSADGKYSGITVTGTGGATIAFGDLVTLDKDDSRWELVDISVAAAATGDARGVIGIAVTSSTDGGALTILLDGIIRADANFPALTIGAPVYASTTGDIVVTQPTTTDHVIRIVGYALTADEIRFNPGNTWTTHT